MTTKQARRGKSKVRFHSCVSLPLVKNYDKIIFLGSVELVKPLQPPKISNFCFTLC